MISLKRVNAIFQKDFKDFSRNYAISIVIFIPIVLGAVYGRMGVDTIETHFMLINMTFSMVAAFVQCCLIAEEREKNTLRGLMLSPASTSEILGGKSLLTFLFTMIVVFFTAYLAEYQPKNFVIIAVAVVLSSFFYIALGTLLGLYSKSVMEASVLIMPVIIIFSLGSFITLVVEKYPILKAATYLPNIQLVELASKVDAGAGFADVLVELAIILGWVIASFILTVIIYRKRMVD